MGDICKVMDLKVEVTENIFSKNALFWRRHTDERFAVKDHLVFFKLGQSLLFFCMLWMCPVIY